MSTRRGQPKTLVDLNVASMGKFHTATFSPFEAFLAICEMPISMPCAQAAVWVGTWWRGEALGAGARTLTTVQSSPWWNMVLQYRLSKPWNWGVTYSVGACTKSTRKASMSRMRT